MDSVESNFLRLGKYVVGILFVWFGLVGLLDVGFTTITAFPLVDFKYVLTTVFIAQILIGLAVFNSSLRRFAKPVLILYFLLIIFNGYLTYPQLFTPAIPYLSDLGRDVFLEALILFAGFSYLKRR